MPRTFSYCFPFMPINHIYILQILLSSADQALRVCFFNGEYLSIFFYLCLFWYWLVKMQWTSINNNTFPHQIVSWQGRCWMTYVEARRVSFVILVKIFFTWVRIADNPNEIFFLNIWHDQYVQTLFKYFIIDIFDSVCLKKKCSPSPQQISQWQNERSSLCFFWIGIHSSTNISIYFCAI